ncbi:acyl-CoA dehydrogenase [Sphingobium cupriresistens]|uniref:Acyl-CoA dehydrogenase n=1 Tax=Sphingobium cupriresistens LL01 TaxID=1420583 RepID=A0A0J7XYQ3_9SPHN|nr:acyl-CoA dehydrogenase [Sphingobium cupriresistens]KMS56811.1 acyl-CoA dehydrogenase [Sphingobium cupriresistens LL01]
MSHSLIVRQDIDFLLHDWLGLDDIADRTTVDAVIDLSEKLAIDHFLPHYKQADVEEPTLTADGVHICPPIGEALKHYADLGLFSAGFPEELGGLGLPYLACAASFAYFAAANLATSAYPMLTVANARLIATFGTQAQIRHFAIPQIEGRWFGTMCLSEPQAGSSLADVRTRAEADGQDDLGDRYRLVGNKMWISGGDQDVSQNIVHLVLAKVAGRGEALPVGTEGLSLFIVPKYLPDGTRNDIEVAGLNHKMGYRGTANCLLNLGETTGAIGWIVGQPGQGLRQMFQMMNEARISVGLGAAAVGYRGYRLSVAYANERLQGRPAGVRDGPQVPISAHSDVRRMLLAQKAYVEGALALCLYSARLVDDESDADSASLLGLLTPITKTWPSEYGLAANDIAIQIHGGYGYTRDFDVEQLWRDNRLNPIHEGTTGIQAADLLGRKILRDGTGMIVLEARIATTVERAAAVEDLAAHGVALSAAWVRVRDIAAQLGAGDAGHLFDNATPYLWAFGHVVVGWLWLDQAILASQKCTASDAEAQFLAGKARAARFFFECELPKIDGWLAVVASASMVAAEAPPSTFQ